MDTRLIKLKDVVKLSREKVFNIATYLLNSSLVKGKEFAIKRGSWKLFVFPAKSIFDSFVNNLSFFDMTCSHD
jgi:hypothetical protein